MIELTLTPRAELSWQAQGYIELGRFSMIEDGSVYVADPCYLDDATMRIEVALRAGTYQTRCLVAKHEDWGRRIVAVLVESIGAPFLGPVDTRTRFYHDSCLLRTDLVNAPLMTGLSFNRSLQIGEIGVDTGAIVIVDAARRPNELTDCYDKTLDEGIGVGFSTGVGDGGYPLHALCSFQGTEGLFLDFLPAGSIDLINNFWRRRP